MTLPESVHFSDYDVAKILHYGVREDIKKKGKGSPEFFIY